MLRNDFKSTDRVVFEGHKLMTRGILFFGAFAIFLAGMIFLFPAFIGALIATLILLTGLIALVVGYRFWKMNNMETNISRLHSNFEKIRSDMPQYYRFRTFRFTRW